MELLSVNTGRARPLQTNGRAVLSAIDKRPVIGPIAVRPLGLEGDEQADLTVHGGLAKAVYAYPHEHYAVWQTLRAQARVAPWDDKLPPGAMGENLTLRGLLENMAWIGDVLQFPGCALAISEPRFPCFKFSARMGFAQAVKMMVQSGTCGFYLSVRVPGTLSPGDRFELVAGPREVRIDELFRARTEGKR